MIEQYLPVILLFLIAAAFAGGTLVASVIAGKSGKSNAIKNSAYECGMLPEGAAQPRFSVKFYMVAMLFVLFDIEVVFLYPWAVIFSDYIVSIGTDIFFTMLGFVGILLVAFIYAWKKKALDWSAS